MQFTITENHLKLLKRMNVGWGDCEYGAPKIDPKRPYGNSNVESDIAEIIGVEVKCEECGRGGSDIDLAELHQETETALEICLQTLSFETGTYQREDSYSDWKKVN